MASWFVFKAGDVFHGWAQDVKLSQVPRAPQGYRHVEETPALRAQFDAAMEAERVLSEAGTREWHPPVWHDLTRAITQKAL